MAHVGADVGDLRQRDAAETRDACAEGEGDGVDAPGRHADAAGHGAVLRHGADEHAQPRLVHQRPDQGQHEQRKADDDDAIERQDDGRQDFDTARHPGRVGDFDVLRAEDHTRRLDQHQGEAPGGEQGFQRAAVEPADHRALEQHADGGRGEESDRHGGQQVPVEVVGKVAAEQALHGIGGIRADHQQLAVGHVDHAHHAVGDGQAQRREQQDGAEAQARKHAADVFREGQPVLDREVGLEGGSAHFDVGFVGRLGLGLEHGLGVGVGAGGEAFRCLEADLRVFVLERRQRMDFGQQGADLRLGFAVARLGQHRRHGRVYVGGDFLDRLVAHLDVGIDQLEYCQRAFEFAPHTIVEGDLLAFFILQAAVGKLLQQRQRFRLCGECNLANRGNLVVGFLGRQLAYQGGIRRGLRGASQQQHQQQENSRDHWGSGKRRGRPLPAAQYCSLYLRKTITPYLPSGSSFFLSLPAM